jgi:dTDP-D-glucose 4,6-dehydratase
MPNLEVKFSLIYKSQHWPASFNVTKAERELGWKPTIDIEEAVNLYIQCLRNKDPYWYLRNTVKKERGAHEGG